MNVLCELGKSIIRLESINIDIIYFEIVVQKLPKKWQFFIPEILVAHDVYFEKLQTSHKNEQNVDYQAPGKYTIDLIFLDGPQDYPTNKR